MSGASSGNFSPWSKPGQDAGASAQRRSGAPAMHPTRFWTGAVPAQASIEIVDRKPWPQRVILQEIVGAVFVSDSPAALAGPRAINVQPAPQVIVVAPNQTLYAAGGAGGGTLGFAVSAAIPPGFRRRMRPSFFGSMPQGQLLEAAEVPQRVSVTLPGLAFGQVGVDPRSVFAAQGQSMRITGLNLYTFVLAPGQGLYGQLLPGSAVAPFAVHASDLGTGAAKGPTGIPGPDGQE